MKKDKFLLSLINARSLVRKLFLVSSNLTLQKKHIISESFIESLLQLLCYDNECNVVLCFQPHENFVQTKYLNDRTLTHP